jgi:hypothetical protein
LDRKWQTCVVQSQAHRATLWGCWEDWNGLIGNVIHHGRGGEQVGHGFGLVSSRSHCLTHRARVALGDRWQGLWRRRSQIVGGNSK